MPLERLFDSTGVDIPPDALYTDLALPDPPEDRPYTFINMVSTVDGKIRLGPPGTTAQGLGSPTDQMLMRRLRESADGAIIGAGTLRPSNMVYDPRMWRAVVTRSGSLPLKNRFFTDAPDKAIVFAPGTLPANTRERLQTAARVELVGEDSVDLPEAMRRLRTSYGVQYLALEGGADLNFDFLSAGLVDELFITIAPKLKGGTEAPTPVTGEGFPGSSFLPLAIRSVYRDGNELYLRYAVLRPT